MSNVEYIHQPEPDDYYDAGWQQGGGPRLSRARGVDLRHVLRLLWRRKMLLVATSFIVTTLAVLGVMQATPLYVAESEIVIERQRERTLDFQEVLQGGNFDFYTTSTEAAVIMSRRTAEKVVDELDLVNHPIFNPSLRPEKRSFFSGIDITREIKSFARSLIPEWVNEELERLRQSSDEQGQDRPRLSQEERARLFREHVIDGFVGGIDVLTSERSRVLRIQYVSPDPDFAALASNALAEIYINETVLRKFEANARATDWLNQQVAELRKRLEASTEALQDHRKKVGLIDEGQTSMLGQQLSQLNLDLVRNRAARSEAEARYQQVQKLLKSPEGVEAAGTVLESQLIQRLREQEATVIRELSELQTSLRKNHPRYILKENELTDLQKKIRREVDKVAANLGNELEIARIREQNTEKEVTRLKEQIEEQNVNLVRLRALESEVEANQKIYDAILNRFKQTDVQDDSLQQADARLISPAIPPSKPSYPRKTLIVAMAFFASIGLGVILVFVVEHMETGFRSMQDLEEAVGLPGLGLVPSLGRRQLRGREPQDLVSDEPSSFFAESIRTIRTALQISSPTPPKVVLLTSSVPNEGKSSLSVSIARSATKGGQRAIVVDSDIRSPSLHDAFDVPNLRGLSEYLAGDAELEEVIDIDPSSGVHYITAGQYSPRITDQLGGQRMLRLLDRLRHAYDFIVVDSAPVLAVSDALAMLRLVDKTIYVVRWGETPRENVESGIHQLQEARADVAGLVLTQVDMKEHASYGYGGEYGEASGKYYNT
jgi:succinoglycan biosynthesis transport protein ExoP